MIDTHAHLDMSAFDGDREQLFEAMHRSGITSVILPGVSVDQWQKQIQIAQQFDCFFSLGIHPWYVPESIDAAIIKLDAMLQQHSKNKRLVAVGECGLDKLHHWSDKQLLLLEKQLALAQTYQLPVILHAVKAHQELLTMLAHFKLTRGGVVHGFYGNSDMAKRYISLGFKLGVGGLILNPSAKKLRETVVNLPLEHFLLETDSPSMAPFDHPQSRNTPLTLLRVVSEIAFLKEKSTVCILEQLNQNALQLFDL
ncbi:MULTISPECIES: TatD family hydrolase [Shewanella]|uniref:TatD family deoxyribonuclease n=1 Tax=Shewanella psychromarinicola TaxID=2487742 RepID=A0A3N4EDY5_9GAMM|nr:TatD family hydrolase [Shewanella psychromarinicola]AZG37599.1 TatD family deoxyribonuclease [Shewanella psychromarinicola]MCL1081797.1 TatD family hydrolase [Shewanella psychromarinicola]RPA35152.1 TatD family deoxyribonuclease [Shewanella psychromarinicola]